MSLRKVIDYQIVKAEGDLVGRIASPWYLLYDVLGNSQWSCDVDIGQAEVLRNVPLALNNREILYAEVGKPVALRRLGNGRFEVVGLSKHVLSDTHIIYVTFQDSVGEVVGGEWRRYSVRLLTYAELDLYGGYGFVAYGTYGRFDFQGNLIDLIPPR